MPKEYLLIDGDRSFKQDAWTEETDIRGRVTKPARPARDEVEVSVRLDRQYRAVLRLDAGQATGSGRRDAIAAACARFAIGENISPGVQVVEVEERFTEARTAVATPEERDERGNITRPESFTPARSERTEWAFTCRIDGMHLVKLGMSEAEMAQANWRSLLAGKVSPVEVWEL